MDTGETARPVWEIKTDHAAVHLFQDHDEVDISRALARHHIGLGKRLYDNQLLESAAGHFFKAAALFGAAFDFCDAEDIPTVHEVMTYLGCIHQRMNRHPEARMYFMRSAELDPVRSSDRGGVAEYLVRHGSAGEIARYFEGERRAGVDTELAPFFARIAEEFPNTVARLECKLADAGAQAEGKPGLIIPVPVWGGKYVETLLNYAVPNWLAPGNFPALANLYRIHLEFFCGPEDVAAIRYAEITKKLGEVAEVDFASYDKDLLAASDHHVVRFQLFSYPHYAALEAARRRGGDVVLAFPDNIVSDGFYGSVGKYLRQGEAVVACQGFRLSASHVLPIIDARHRDGGGNIAIQSRDMVRLLIDHLAEDWFAESERFTETPFVACWRAGDGGIVVRSSHFMPYGIQAKYLSHALTPHIDPVDGLFLPRHFGALDKVRIIDDMEMCVFDAGDDATMGGGVQAGSLDEYRFARFLQEYLTPLHRRYLLTPLRLSDGAEDEDLRRAERKSGMIVDRVLRVLDGFDADPPRRPAWVPPMHCEMVVDGESSLSGLGR